MTKTPDLHLILVTEGVAEVVTAAVTKETGVATMATGEGIMETEVATKEVVTEAVHEDEGEAVTKIEVVTITTEVLANQEQVATVTMVTTEICALLVCF